MVSAHLDHLGVGVPVADDSIYNGAYDNASGIAMLPEVARAFRALPPPRRSILFVATMGEERGLQGSDYFARHATPDERTVGGDLNLDRVLLMRPLRQVVAFGAEHSSIGPVLNRAAGHAGLRLVPDPTPEEVVFVRSDQFSFLRQGIPAVFPVSSGDGSAKRDAIVSRGRLDHYHTPSDDLSLPFDWEGGTRFMRMASLATWRLANDSELPRWNAGDCFGWKFPETR